MDNDADVRRQRLETLLKWGIGLIGAIVVAPYIFLAVKGMVGLAIAIAVGLLITQLAPVFSMKLANWRMGLIVAEAEANPIETMQNLYLEKSQELNRADNNIADFETEIRNFDDQLGDFKTQYPAEADSYDALSLKMHQALDEMKREQTQARRELQNFDQQITKAKAIYKMSLAAQKVVKLSKSAEAQVFAKIKEQVAFDSVRTQLNRSFANLNLALERRNDTRAALPGVTGTVIDMPSHADRALVERNKSS
jgi:septal ring factor EnvC (AmiA/AmiB activator)